jgi:hypothetical protein
MSQSNIVAMGIDKELYPTGLKTVIEQPTRKWLDRPAMVVGEAVEILQLKWIDNYGPFPRVLVRKEDGQERWIDAVTVKTATEMGALV